MLVLRVLQSWLIIIFGVIVLGDPFIEHMDI